MQLVLPVVISGAPRDTGAARLRAAAEGRKAGS